MYRLAQLDVLAKHLGTIQLGLFGSKSYVQLRGRPTCPEEIVEHDVIGYDLNDTMICGFREAGMDVEFDFFPVRCDNNTVVWELVRAGAGLGFGLSIAGEDDPTLTRIEFGVPLPKLDVWLAAHEVMRHASMPSGPCLHAVWNRFAAGTDRRSLDAWGWAR